ncbi:hypothetical protein P4B35_15930 [Pontiellaceae bacterium B12227]|nr:hypothetical protein [Pontiellaceae bacterium B12227]
MSKEIHIIEPTLENQIGHCYSFNLALSSHLDFEKNHYHLWLNKNAELDLNRKFTLHPYFQRKLRRIQLALLLSKLLKQEQHSVFIPTCTLTDLEILSLCAGGSHRKQNRITAYVHWFKLKPKRVKRLLRLANKLEAIHILVPTTKLHTVFKKAGFKRVSIVAYPTEISTDIAFPDQEPAFNKVIYSGAARIDKGFVEVTHYLQYLEENKKEIPISIQTSSTHSGSIPAQLETALDRVKNSRYPWLTTVEQTLDIDQYRLNFQQSISLMFYDPADFDERISGVALDSLCIGAPIICNEGHWIAQQVMKYNAGIVLPDINNESIHDAVQEISENFAAYYERARHASRDILEIHSPRHLAAAIEN